MSRSIPGRRGLVAAFAAIALCLTTMANGQPVWLEAEAAQVTPGATLWLELRNGPAFADPAATLGAAAAGEVGGSLGSDSLARPLQIAIAGRLRYYVTVPRPGVAVLMATLPSRRIELGRDAVETHLREIHATDEVRALWAEIPAPTPWREVREGSLKTFVLVGQPDAAHREWAQPRPSGIDLTPEVDPTAIRENDLFTVRLTEGGTPVPGAVVTFLSFGEDREHVVITDAAGRASAHLDLRGRWLVRGMLVRRVRAPDHEWATTVAALTLAVR